jgi:nitrogen fixation protein NifB
VAVASSDGKEVNAHFGRAIGSVIKVVGIAGPGDPLANDETFEAFLLIKAEFPHLIKCLSTNGLLLPEKIELLQQIGLKSLTVPALV